MAAQAAIPDAAAEHARLRAAETRLELAVAILTSAVVIGSTAYVYTLFAPIAPVVRLAPWSAYIAAVALAMGASAALLLGLRAADAVVLSLWPRLGKAFAILLDLGVGASVWLLLPYASEELRMIMVVLYSALLTGQLATQADAPAVTAFGVVTVFGSTALFFAGSSGDYPHSLAVFLLAFGGLIVAMAFVLKNAIRSALRAQVRAEHATGELAFALERAAAAQGAKTRFIAAATHDLRQPLQAAALFFDQSVNGRDAEARAAAAAGCRAALIETDTILTQLLDHLRLDAGAVEPRLRPVRAAELIGRLAEEMAPAAAAEHVALKASATTLSVRADPDQATRALRNLVVNALRHARCERVLLAARRVGQRVRLYVIDNGVGVAGEDAARLFEEYAQGAAGRERGPGGMGLGLSSARRLAELMGGDANLDRAWRRGAAFYIELPSA